jgi:hypothetical protein
VIAEVESRVTLPPAMAPPRFITLAAWARVRFEELFVNRLKDLLHLLRLDRINADGQPFWRGSKRPPTDVVFNLSNELDAAFVAIPAAIWSPIEGRRARDHQRRRHGTHRPLDGCARAPCARRYRARIRSWSLCRSR